MGMRVLLVTGEKASEMTLSAAEALEELHGWSVETEVLPVELGAFVTSVDVEGVDTSAYDLVLVPGLSRGDYSRLGNVFKGTKSVANLPLLDREDFGDLSPKLPADRLVERPFETDFEGGEPQLYVGDLPVGGDLRMRVMAEVVDSTELPEEELIERSRYFLREGADILDLGVPVDAAPDEVSRAASAVRDAVDAPISVDTMELRQIRAALPYVDMVLSADGPLLDQVGEELAEAEVVVVVISGEEELQENLDEARKLGLETLADPVLDFPLGGLAPSVERFLDIDEPLFFGAGNVTELIDADSTGVNALLSAVAQEVGACILFTPEHSVKARGSVRELALASRMMHVASRKGTPPKDLGRDLLILKDKVDADEPVEEVGEVVEAEYGGYERDPMGYFRIGVDRESDEILAAFHPSNGDPLTIRGPDAASVSWEIADRALVSRMYHGAYLGRELEKAEIALETGKSFRQDFPLFGPEGGKSGH